MNKNQQYQNTILRILVDSPQITVKKIAEKIGLSEKTTRLQLDYLNEYLNQNSIGCIERIPGKGVKLTLEKTINGKFLHLAVQDSSLNAHILPQILEKLLKSKPIMYITQKSLATELYVSLPTLRKAIAEARIWLKENNLEIETIKNKGMRVIGNEVSVRFAIRNLIVQDQERPGVQKLCKFVPGLSIDKCRSIIKFAEEKWKIQFSSELLDRILIMLCLSLYRKKLSDHLQFTIIEGIERFNEYNFAETIYQIAEEQGYDPVSSNDKRILAYEILLSSKLVWLDDSEDKKDIHELTVLDQFVSKFIFTVSDVLKEDLSKDQMLIEDLKEHLRSAIFRIKYGSADQTLIGKQLKQEFNKVYLSVWSTSQLFEEYFDIQISENEVSYIVLYIESALMRKKNKSNLFYTTNQSRSASHYVAELLKLNIPEINEIRIVRSSLPTVKKGESTIHIADHDTGFSNIIKISKIPDNKDFLEIRKALRHGQMPLTQSKFSKSIQSLFAPNLFFMNEESISKELLLKKMTNKLAEEGYVSQDYFSTLWKREQETSTCVGNKTAIPHGAMKEVNEPKIAVCTLKTKMQWSKDEEVQLIFLLAAKMNTKVNIDKTKTFYSDLIRITENEEIFEKLINSQDGVKAYRFLFS